MPHTPFLFRVHGSAWPRATDQLERTILAVRGQMGQQSYNLSLLLLVLRIPTGPYKGRSCCSEQGRGFPQDFSYPCPIENGTWLRQPALRLQTVFRNLPLNCKFYVQRLCHHIIWKCIAQEQVLDAAKICEIDFPVCFVCHAFEDF